MAYSTLLSRFRFFTVLLMSSLLDANPVKAQNTSGIERSPEAIAVIQRAVNASGGVTSVNGIQDVVATGTVSVPINADKTTLTSLTLSEKGLDQLKIDSVFPTGKRSFYYSHDAVSRKDHDGSMVPLRGDDSFKIVSHFFPLTSLAAALQDTSYSVNLTETTTDETSGHTLYHLRVQRHKSATKGPVQRDQSSVALDYYIDASTTLIVRVQHLHLDRGRMPSALGRNPLEIYSFDDYRLDGGLLLPHQIVTSVDKRPISTITIDSYKLNTGLRESDFNAR
jgi:hypothetical protein